MVDINWKSLILNGILFDLVIKENHCLTLRNICVESKHETLREISSALNFLERRQIYFSLERIKN